MAKKKTKRRVKKVKTKKAKTKSKAKTGVKKVNWTLTLIMSILFGMLGVDRFMMGKTATGILKLLITLVTVGVFGWVWWIVDIVLIATKHKFEDVKWVK